MKCILVLWFLAGLAGQITTCGQTAIEGKLELSLLVNNERSLALQKGMPLIFSLTVSNPDAEKMAQFKNSQPIEVDSVDESKLEQIDLRMKGQVLGNAQNPWYESISIERIDSVQSNGKEPIFQLHSENPAPQVVVDAYQRAYIDFGMDPETLDHTDLNVLKYRAKMSYTDKNGNDQWIESNTVRVSFHDPILKDPEAFTDKQLYFCIHYWLLRKNCEKAESLLSTYRERGPDEITKLSLDAEVNECLGNDMEALKSYQRALEKFEELNSYELPVRLIKKVHELQEKLILENK
jgi:hypothetical protein